jgi:hypothetical protein
MSSLYFEKCEVTVQRKVENKCMLCSLELNLWRREHQCKRCFRAVCDKCSDDKLPVYKEGLVRRLHRGCKLCVAEVREVD